MKFAIAQEVSRHVRDKACKFYGAHSKALSTCTVTSSALATSDSMKFLTSNDKVPESPTGLDLNESNFSDILSPSTFALSTSNEAEEIEFGMIIEELAGGEDEQVFEVCFSCKLCEFR